MSMFQHQRVFGRVVRWAAMLAVLLDVHKAMAQAQPAGVEAVRPSEQITQILSKDSKVTLTELQTRVLELEHKIRSVDGHDPEVLTIIPVSNYRVRVKAEKSGVTSFTLTDEFDSVYTVEVFVDSDVRALQAYLGRLFPDSAIEVVGLTDSVVLRGWVTAPAQIPQIMEVAEKFSPSVLNQMGVGGVSQVQLQVKLMEVQRSKLRELGFNFDFVSDDFSLSITPAFIANPTARFTVAGSDSTFRAFVEAVETNALARVLADTAVVTNSGRPATIEVGGEFPVPEAAGLGTTSVRFEPYGVKLEALPIVLGNGRLRLDISPEVSERDLSNVAIVQGSAVPSKTTRRVNTQVEMRFGETFMLGGLILQRQTETRTKIPFLGDLPLVGSAFARRRSEVGETELLIMVTPQIAAPIMPGQLMVNGPGANSESPESHEFYFDGHIEVPAYNRPPVSLNSMYDNTYPVAPGMTSPGLPGGMELPQMGPTPLPGEETATPEASGPTVTQTSGVFQPRKKDRPTTGGATTSPGTGSRSGASVRANAGDNLRASGSGRTGGGTEPESASRQPGRRLQLIEPPAR